jgi:hypothetical protein
MLNFNKDLTEKLNLEGNIGFNLRNKCKTFAQLMVVKLLEVYSLQIV